MSKEMLINVSEGEECRIALVEDGRLEELYMERTSSTSHVGNVYKGRVTNVEPSIQAAFVDFGLGRNGFLHISDLMPTYFGGKAEDVKESVGRKMARRDRPPIQKCLRRGDEIIVQIIKEGIGTKGPTLSTYVSIPGRILVMMPGMAKLGVSRKIEDEEERKRLRTILDGLKPPKDCGFIIRTAGVGKSKAEIERDLKYLTRLYENINKKAKGSGGPTELYAEGDLVTRTVRDVMTSDVERIVVDSEDVAKKIKEFFKLVAPRTKNKVELYEEPVPLFHKYNIEREIEMMYSRHVPLPSGGSLVIDSTEAIVAIDVNSGKFRDHSDAETTAFKTDMEAADEIPRQLRLRDLGGVIICDFIDLRFERHRRELEKRLHENLNSDRAKTKMLRMSQFGIIEMTRQRMRPSLKRSIYSDCPHCKGAGLVKTPESMSLDVMRRLAIGAHDARVVRVELAVCQEVAFYLQNKKRAEIARLEQESGKRVIVRVDATLGLDESKLELYDARDGLVYLAELGMSPADQAGQQQGGGRGGQHGHQQQGRGGRGGRGERGGRGGRGGGRDEQRGGRDRDQRGQGRDDRDDSRDRRRDEAPADDLYDVESVEERVEEREEERAEQAAADAAVRAPISPAQDEPYEGEIESAPPPVAFDDDEEPETSHDDDDEREFAEAPAAIDDRAEEAADSDLDQAPEDVEVEEEQPRQPRHQPPAPQPPPQPQPVSPYDAYEDEIELQPRGITHERPNPKDRGGRGGRGGGRQQGRGGRGGGAGRGGRGSQQQRPEPQPPRGEGEMSLAERFAMELAAERAANSPQRRQPQGGGITGGLGGGGQRHQQGQHRQQSQPGGGPHRNQQGGGQHRQQQGGGHRQQPQGGGGGHRPQQQHQPQPRPPQQQQPPQGPRPDANFAAGQAGQGEGGGGGGRRRRRRRRGRGGAANEGGLGEGQHQSNPQSTQNGDDHDGNEGGGGGGQGQAPQQSASPQTPVQRTGSSDRHLLHDNDEPVLPQPLSRPRSYRDLDQIPDDLD